VSWEIKGKQYRKLFRNNHRQKPNLGESRRTNTYVTYSLVNKVSLETDLHGVLPYEIGTSALKASLKAQAVIARTYALRNLRRFAIDDY
jgi:peptidoglycan hydrolase-like amidase